MAFDKSWAEPTSDDRVRATSDDMYRWHSRAVFAVCLANTRNHHDAEDVMQAVFVKALTKGSTLREPGRLRAWLLQVARRACVDFHRKQRLTEMLVQEPAVQDSSDRFWGERLHDAIQKLPQSYREAIVLYYLDGRDCSNVAAALGATEAAVRQRLVRARVMLHGLLQEGRP